MKKYLLFFLSMTLFINITYAGVIKAPRSRYNQTYKAMDMAIYGWVNYYPEYSLDTSVNKEGLRFIGEYELERYVKLKIRSFLKDIKFVDSEDNNYSRTRNNLILDLDIYKYNDSLEIYYGLFEMEITPCDDYLIGRNYRITVSIAGGKDQIKEKVRDSVNEMIEFFAEDYYYMKDLTIDIHQKESGK